MRINAVKHFYPRFIVNGNPLRKQGPHLILANTAGYHPKCLTALSEECAENLDNNSSRVFDQRYNLRGAGMSRSYFVFRAFVFVFLAAWHHGVAFSQPPHDSDSLPPIETNGELTGHVVTEDGSPVAARVFLLRSPEEGGHFTLPTKPLETQSDADGGFALEQLDDGEYRLWAETDQQTSLKQKLKGQTVSVKKSAMTAPPVTVSLHPGCGYDVTVVDGEGAPLADANISFGWTDIKRTYSTNENGLASIRNLSVDEWYFVVSADGYETLFLPTSKQKLGTVLPLNFEMRLGGQIEGRVVDGEGNGVADARLTVSSAEVSMSPTYGRDSTDVNGAFTVVGLPLDRQVRVHVSKDNYMGVRKEVAAVAGEQPTQLELTMQRRPYGGDVRVTVVDEQGQPIAGANLFNQGNSSADVREATTDAQGTALLQDVFDSYAGHQIVAKSSGYVAQQKSAETDPLGQPTELAFELVHGNTLNGRILTPEGKPLPKLKIYYDHGENGDLLGGRVLTDDDGRFTLTGLKETVLFTVYTPPQYAPISQIEVRTDLDELMELTLVPAGILFLRAIDSETGESIEAYNVRLGFCEQKQADDLQPNSLSSSLINPGTNLQGESKEFRLENQVVGTAFKVIVSAVGYEPTTIDRMVTQSIAGAELIDVELSKLDPEDYQTVAGRLIDADGEPVVGAAVRLLAGRDVPQANRRGFGKSMGGWNFYHWGLLSADQIEGRDQCEQLLKTVSDAQGLFRFVGVKRDAPWLELFYFGDGIFAQRYSNLRDRDDRELEQLELPAARPAQLTVRIDRELHAGAERLSLQAEDYSRGENAIMLPFASEDQAIKAVNVFERLPAGSYRLSLQAKPEPTGDGGFLVKSLAEKAVVIEEGKALELEF